MDRRTLTGEEISAGFGVQSRRARGAGGEPGTRAGTRWRRSTRATEWAKGAGAAVRAASGGGDQQPHRSMPTTLPGRAPMATGVSAVVRPYTRVEVGGGRLLLLQARRWCPLLGPGRC